MSNTDKPSFESLLEQVQRLRPTRSDPDRVVQWCDATEIIGVARQPSGAIEIFLSGEELVARSALVRRHLKFDLWNRTSGERFQANRLVLPPAEYFTPTAAFLVEELLRRGVAVELAAGFARCEPLIEMALRRAALTEEELLGLLGELRVLDALLHAKFDGAHFAQVLDAWSGHLRSSRDFIWAHSAIEVKTTRLARSTHEVHSLGQVNPVRSDSGKPVELLSLVSFGFVAVDDGAGFSLPMITDKILERLGPSGTRNGLQILFLNKLASYGGETGVGYVHDEMKNWPAYETEWTVSFCRIYDLCDPEVKVLSPEIARTLIHVQPESIRFRLEFPEQISGDLNPQTDLLTFVSTFVKSSRDDG